MSLKHIQALYEYNRWANARTLDAASRLTAEQFTKDLRLRQLGAEPVATDFLVFYDVRSGEPK
ncbi:MAG: hypothetical protein HY652_13320 [Acidobacteria bacterium]|nr:hypothetical protein [Acidobacteriota bacterium]